MENSTAQYQEPGAESLLTIDDVRAAAQRIAGAVIRTPTLYSETLSNITGANIWLKFENHQFTAAYKERGALNALLQLTEEQRQRGVIAASAGNHSQGLSYHGTRLGVPVTIVMPRTTPHVKVMQTQSVGGIVVQDRRQAGVLGARRAAEIVDLDRLARSQDGPAQPGVGSADIGADDGRCRYRLAHSTLLSALSGAGRASGAGPCGAVERAQPAAVGG